MNAFVAVLLANAVLVLPIAIAAWATMRFFHRPAIAHALWVLALIKFLTPPLVSPELVVDPKHWPTLASLLPGTATETVALPTAELTNASGSSTNTVISVPPQAAPTPAGISVPATPIPKLTRAEVGQPVSVSHWVGYSLLVVWAGGSLFCVCLFVRRIRLVAWLIRSSGKQDSVASGLAESLLEDSLRGPPRVILVDAVISPTLVGVGQWTRILYPRRLWQELPSEQRTSLLVHELEHFRRFDHWVRILEACTTTVFWWHPVVWWARKQIEITEESCCDAVAARQCRAMPYAEALLTTLDFINEPSWSPSAPVGTGVSRLPVLEQRLKQIVHRRFTGRLSVAGRIGLLLFASIALPVQPLLLGGRLATAAAVTKPAVMVSPEPQILLVNQPEVTTETVAEPIDLPPAPEGWWSPKPVRSWTHVAGNDPSLPRLIANASGDVLLQGGIVEGTIDLSGHNITAAAFWKSSTRLVTGDQKGQVRLWDVASGEPVSLLGLHRSPVTSLAISDDGTLITGGQDGTLIAWDVQSGSVRATWTTNRLPIQSVRLVDQGQRAIVVASDWRRGSADSRIVVVDAQQLQPLSDLMIPITLATTRTDNGQLTFVDWSGTLHQFNELGVLEAVGTTSKSIVSAYVFSQDAQIDNSEESKVVRS